MVCITGSSFDDFIIISGLLLVQALYGFYSIFLNRILALGFSSLFLIFTGSFAGAIFLLPFAIAFERKKWPARITAAIMVQFGLIALGGVTMFQGLLLLGIKRTTPAIASAMPNLIPGFVFVIAAILRFEKFSIWCKYSQVKVLGTFVCLGGAIAMTLLQNPTASKILFFLDDSAEENIYKDWLMGCFYLLAAIITASCIMVLQVGICILFSLPASSNVCLQAATMVSFPAPFSLCVITSLIGAILTGILQILTEGKLNAGSSNVGISFIILAVVVVNIQLFHGTLVFSLFYTKRVGRHQFLFHTTTTTSSLYPTTWGRLHESNSLFLFSFFQVSVISSTCVVYQTWCIRKKGPVLVSIFSPIQTVCATSLSMILFGQSISLGSSIGILIMIIGLYLVLWAKRRECPEPIEENQNLPHVPLDIEKPLLS
ncbi:WAT1-related protein At5g47470-like [Dendrobium catenatum]|uniref:WAT1-related protein At5g47470-like n=1 Tax=Dendrobium catenatum TaxID=906689 RepID=UPI0010A04C77|nr:WAT1-related protein At5g47470-like [Dendrobium catenatum]